MWNSETIVLNLLVIVHEDIKVNVPRAFVDDLLPTHCVFDVLQLVQQMQWLQIGFDLFVVSILVILRQVAY
jgi:hypothetical protein